MMKLFDSHDEKSGTVRHSGDHRIRLACICSVGTCCTSYLYRRRFTVGPGDRRTARIPFVRRPRDLSFVRRKPQSSEVNLLRIDCMRVIRSISEYD